MKCRALGSGCRSGLLFFLAGRRSNGGCRLSRSIAKLSPGHTKLDQFPFIVSQKPYRTAKVAETHNSGGIPAVRVLVACARAQRHARTAIDQYQQEN